MAERLIAPVLKTGLGKTNGGSNPSFSAKNKMRTKILFCTVAFAAFFFAACNSSTTKTETKEEAKQDSTLIAPQPGDRVMYQCPMDPEEISDKPGKCPKCGMDLEKIVVRGKDTIRS